MLASEGESLQGQGGVVKGGYERPGLRDMGLVVAVSSHESATFRGRGGHVCGKVARLATRQRILHLCTPLCGLARSAARVRERKRGRERERERKKGFTLTAHVLKQQNLSERNHVPTSLSREK